jgi:protein-disulfide isomerase
MSSRRMLLEFTDYECPMCRAYHLDTFRRLKTTYIDTGRVRFVSRDQPMAAFHPHAMDAAHAGRCAGDQGKFWEMRDLLLANGERLAGSAILEYARQARLDEPVFSACVSARKDQREIDQDVADAIALKLRGTPQFVLDRMSGQTLEGIVIVGAQPYETFAAAIDGMLNAAPR